MNKYKVIGSDSIVEILGWETISPYCFAAFVFDTETGDTFLVREENLISLNNE